VAIFTGPQICGWRHGYAEDGAVHIEPVGDTVEHEVYDCACGPTTEPVKAADGSVGWLVVHHSLDGRELEEEART
jgi:hypothetical protein